MVADGFYKGEPMCSCQGKTGHWAPPFALWSAACVLHQTHLKDVQLRVAKNFISSGEPSKRPLQARYVNCNILTRVYLWSSQPVCFVKTHYNLCICENTENWKTNTRESYINVEIVLFASIQIKIKVNRFFLLEENCFKVNFSKSS